MFVNTSLETLIHPVTLKFKDPKIEQHYRDFQNADFLRDYKCFYWIIASVTIIMLLTCYVTYTMREAGMKREALGSMLGSIMLLVGIMLELLVNAYERLHVIKSVPLVAFIFAACIIVNSALQLTPNLRPG